jgi:hypothetical protein
VNPLGTEIDQVLTTLVTTSLELVRDTNRDPSWARPPRTGAGPSDIAEGLKQQYSTELAAPDQENDPVAAAIAILVTLCEQVAAEDGTGDGLAASVASIDWATSPSHPQTPTSPPSMRLLPWGLRRAQREAEVPMEGL